MTLELSPASEAWVVGNGAGTGAGMGVGIGERDPILALDMLGMGDVAAGWIIPVALLEGVVGCGVTDPLRAVEPDWPSCLTY